MTDTEKDLKRKLAEANRRISTLEHELKQLKANRWREFPVKPNREAPPPPPKWVSQ